MPDIKKLTDKSNVEFYPRTVMDAVYDSQTGRTLANGVPASKYRSFTINNPIADTSIDGFEYSQTFDWDNVLATDEASADIVSGYSSDYSVGVETLQDSIKLYFDEDPTDAVIRVILYPASIGNLPSDTVANLRAQMDSIAYTNVPIGAVQGFLLPQAPTGWLACDGGTYAVADYKALYDKLVLLPSETRATWGNADWVTEFNVPNLQGEFLRGSGANGHSNQGSGSNVGIHQDGTLVTNYYIYDDKITVYGNESTTHRISNSDYSEPSVNSQHCVRLTGTSSTSNSSRYYTSRPTNTSVLYCIKYTYIYDGVTDVTGSAAVALDNRVTDLEGRCEYSTTEKVVGKWLDGKPLYEKAIPFQFNSTSGTQGQVPLTEPSNIKEIIEFRGHVSVGGAYNPIPLILSTNWFLRPVWIKSSTFRLDYLFQVTGSNSGYLIIRYTKTTD